jgi:hypothetical protein
MDSSPGWRRVVFALLVCALVGLGAYLIGPVAHRGSGGTPPAAAQSPAPSATASAVPAPSASPASPTGTSAAPDIYQWLPFTQAELAAAVNVVVRFGDAYGSYSYAQSADAYLATLQPVTDSQLAAQIKQAFSAPGVVAARQSGKQVATGTTTIQSIRSFGSTSITFVAEVDQQITATSGRSHQDTVYAVTVTGSDTTWQVTDVEFASAGNS